MAIVKCKLDRVFEATIDNRNRGTYGASWIAEANSLMGPKQVLNACLAANLAANDPAGQPNHPIPNLGEDYDLTAYFGPGEYDPYSYALNYGCRNNDSKLNLHEITVSWTPLSPGETQENRQITNPVNRGADFWWEQEPYQKIADRQNDGTPYVNGAGKSFDRPPTIEAFRPVLMAQFNVATLNAAYVLQNTYSGATNSTAWTFLTPNAGARTFYCRYMRSGKVVTEGANSYYPMEAAFALKEDGGVWDARDLNEGYGYWEEDDGQTYGYGAATSNFTTSTNPIPLTGAKIVVNNASASVPTSVAQPAPPISGLSGDQLSLVYISSAWAVGEPTAKDTSNAKNYIKAKDKDGESVSEPVLLYQSGVKLPEGMQGNYVTGRLLREADFNNLNAIFTATP